MPKQNTTAKPVTPDQQRAEARSPDSYPTVTGGSPSGLHPEAAKAREGEYAKAIQALRGDSPKHATVAKCLRELDEARPHEMSEFLILQCDLYKRACSVVQQTAHAAGQRIKLTRVYGMLRGRQAPADGNLESLADQVDSLQRSISIASKKANLHGYWSTFIIALQSEQPRLFADWGPENAVEVPDDAEQLNNLQADLRERWEQQANFWTSRGIDTECRDGWLYTAYSRPTEQPRKTIRIVNTTK